MMVAVSAAAAACDGTTEPDAPPESSAPATPDPADQRVFSSLDVTVFGSSELVAILGMNARYLQVHARDQNGMQMPVGKGSFSIESSDSNVVRVTDSEFWSASSNGTIDETWIQAYAVAVGPGKAVVTFSWTTGGFTRTASTSVFTVESGEGWTLKIDPEALTLHVGSREPIKAMMLDQAGNQRAVLYDLFSVDHNDLVALERPCEECGGMDAVGLLPGEATITVTWGRLSARAAVTVLP
jgi:hypothetical protein